MTCILWGNSYAGLCGSSSLGPGFYSLPVESLFNKLLLAKMTDRTISIMIQIICCTSHNLAAWPSRKVLRARRREYLHSDLVFQICLAADDGQVFSVSDLSDIMLTFSFVGQ